MTGPCVAEEGRWPWVSDPQLTLIRTELTPAKGRIQVCTIDDPLLS